MLQTAHLCILGLLGILHSRAVIPQPCHEHGSLGHSIGSCKGFIKWFRSRTPKVVISAEPLHNNTKYEQQLC